MSRVPSLRGPAGGTGEALQQLGLHPYMGYVIRNVDKQDETNHWCIETLKKSGQEHGDLSSDL